MDVLTLSPHVCHFPDPTFFVVVLRVRFGLCFFFASLADWFAAEHLDEIPPLSFHLLQTSGFGRSFSSLSLLITPLHSPRTSWFESPFYRPPHCIGSRVGWSLSDATWFSSLSFGPLQLDLSCPGATASISFSPLLCWIVSFVPDELRPFWAFHIYWEPADGLYQRVRTAPLVWFRSTCTSTLQGPL